MLRVEVSGTQRITYTQAWDAENRLVAVTTPTGTVQFRYDGDGNRVLRIGPEGTTIYIGDHFEKQGAVVTKYYYAAGQRIAMRVGGVVYWLHSDHLGSATLTTDGGGNWVGEARYTPYGEMRRDYPRGMLPTDRRYTGQRWDLALALYDYRARYYHPALGRFVQADSLLQTEAKNPTPYLPLAVSYANPKVLEQWNRLQRSRLQREAQAPNTPSVLDPQFLNRYTYARNNPLCYTDPDGHLAFLALLVPGLIGAAAGGLGYAASVALTGQEFNVKSFAVATGVGFVAGALAPVVAVNAVGAVALGAAANVTQYALTQVVNEQPLSIQDAAINAGAGVVGGAITGPYTANALRAGVDLAGARMVAPQFYKEISRQILVEDVRLGFGTFVRSFAGSTVANYLPSVVEPLDSSPLPSAENPEIVYVPISGPIPW